jgi:GAF domain-containing protein
VNPHREYQRLHALHALHLLDAPAPSDLEDLCREAQAHFQVAMALITLVYSDRQVVWARAGTDLEGTPRSDAFCDHLIRCDQVLVVPDAKKDARFVANLLVTGKPHVRFYAGAPLMFTREVRLGGFCLLDTEPREFSPAERADLATMADEVMFRILERELSNIPLAH